MKNSIYAYLLALIYLSGCNAVTDNPDPGLVYVWSGAPATNGITIAFKTAGEQNARVYLHKKPDFSDTVAVSDEVETKNKNYFTGKVRFDSLHANTPYFYSLYYESLIKKITGSFRTLPEGASSFKVAFGSCARTGSDHPVFATINRLDPLFYMNIGDFHYENIRQNCSNNFAYAFFRNLRSHYQANLYSSRPFIYIWDDHDYGPNNASEGAPCRDEALEAYRTFVPHYPLAFEDEGEPVSQSFSVGRVHFVLTDLRSAKKIPEYKGCERVEEGTNFGSEEHINWFKDQLLMARDSGRIVAWVNSIPWISDQRSPKYECDEKDDWAGFSEERAEIADFIKQNKLPVFMLSGDAHMLAIDDGSNSDYATGGGAEIPVFHAAPLDQVGIYKGGPYSHGYSRKRGQFGMLEVEDAGGSDICITFKGLTGNGEVARNISGNPLVYKFCKSIR